MLQHQGSTYVFKLTASAGAADGYAEIAVVVNAPPTSGTLSTTPATGGVALTTIFDVACNNWVDAIDDLPLW